jgi:hypothetical protein
LPLTEMPATVPPVCTGWAAVLAAKAGAMPAGPEASNAGKRQTEANRAERALSKNNLHGQFKARFGKPDRLAAFRTRGAARQG